MIIEKTLDMEGNMEDAALKSDAVIELTISTVLNLLRLKSESLYNHSLKTSIMAHNIIKEIDDDETHQQAVCPVGVRLAAILHDIGKLSVPDAVLNKRGKLNPEEVEMIKLHSLKSYETADKLLEQHFFLSVPHCCEMKEVAEIILSHHELPDGSGYPHGKNDLSLATKITGIADKMCALMEERTYRTITFPLDYTVKKVLHEIDWGLDTVHLRAINACAVKLLKNG